MAIGLNVPITAGGGGTPVTYSLERQIDGGGYSVVDGSIAYTASPQTYQDNNGGAGFTNGDVVDYRVTATNTDGTSPASVVQSHTVSSSSIIDMEDDFTGTTIDTSKWTLVNPDSTDITYVQNDDMRLRFLTNNSNAVPLGSNILHTKIDKAIADVFYVKFDFQKVSQNETGTWQMGVTDDGADLSNSNRPALITRSSSSGEISFNVTGGTAQGISIDVSTVKSIKIKLTETTTDFYQWNGSAWVALGTQFTHALGALTNCNFFITGIDNGLANDAIYDNLYITNADFSTLNPS